MRLFAISDVHIDYPDNALWVEQVSDADYRDDVLILAGDLTEDRRRLAWCLGRFATKFRQVLFVPGNHDLWVRHERADLCSLRKFDQVMEIASDAGASMQPYRYGNTVVVPLLGWYDYSFGAPDGDLQKLWMDYRACRWPDGFGPQEVTAHFLAMNPESLPHPNPGERVVTFSHFLPRIDLIPSFVPRAMRNLDPVLGSTGIERQLRALSSQLHVYGHSHINRRIGLDGVTYINNAFGYPQERSIAAGRLIEILDIDR
jgi:predicted phosphodiesterase